MPYTISRLRGLRLECIFGFQNCIDSQLSGTLYILCTESYIVEEGSGLLLANVQLSRNSGIPVYISPVEILVSTSDRSAQGIH